MNEPETDRDLFYLIKDTLDNYEEQYILGSWETFVRRKKKRRNAILWYIFTGIAAGLIIGWIGFEIILSNFKDNNSGQKQILEASTEFKPGKKEVEAPIITVKATAAIKRVSKTEGGIKISSGDSRTPSIESSLASSDKSKELIHATGVNTEKYPFSEGFSGRELYMEKRIQYILESYISKEIGNSDRLRANTRESVSDTSLVSQYEKLAFENTASDYNLINDGKSYKFRLGVDVSPGVTSTSTSSSVNFAGGFTADYALSKKIRLMTGIRVERQSVINEKTDSPSWIPPGQTKAELVDLDLPINVMWKFLVRKASSYYLSGGISSVIYLSEKYTFTNYTQKMVPEIEIQNGQANIIYQLENVKTTEQKTETPLNTFDFAGRFNIIFGLERTISKGLFLHVEPYIKIPLSEQTSQNLRFSTSGLTCRILF